MATPNLQVEGGKFQDFEGNPLNGGYLLWQLSHDELYATSNSQVVAGLKIKMTLDSNGSVPASPGTFIYDNSSLTPSGSFYIVRAFKADGTEAWAFPQYFQLTTSPNPLDLGTLVPLNPPGGLISGGGGGGSGTVTSVGLTMPAEFIVAGSPVTTSGTLAVTKANESANTVYAGPASGSAAQPTFRSLAAADTPGSLPTPDQGKFSLWTVGLGFSSATASLGTIGDFPQNSTSGSASVDGPFVPTATEDAYIRLLVTANNSFVLIATQNAISSHVGQWWGGRATVFQAKVRYETSGSLDFQRSWIGLFDGDPTAIAITDSPTTNVLGFLNSSTGAATDWFAVTGGGSVTSTDTTILGSTSVVNLKIIYTPGVNAKFYINGTLVATNTTNLPSSTATMYPMICLDGHGGATTSTLHLMNVYVSQIPA